MIAQGRPLRCLPLPCGLTAVEDCAAAFFAQGKGKAVNPQSARAGLSAAADMHIPAAAAVYAQGRRRIDGR